MTEHGETSSRHITASSQSNFRNIAGGPDDDEQESQQWQSRRQDDQLTHQRRQTRTKEDIKGQQDLQKEQSQDRYRDQASGIYKKHPKPAPHHHQQSKEQHSSMTWTPLMSPHCSPISIPAWISPRAHHRPPDTSPVPAYIPNAHYAQPQYAQGTASDMAQSFVPMHSYFPPNPHAITSSPVAHLQHIPHPMPYGYLPSHPYPHHIPNYYPPLQHLPYVYQHQPYPPFPCVDSTIDPMRQRLNSDSLQLHNHHHPNADGIRYLDSTCQKCRSNDKQLLSHPQQPTREGHLSYQEQLVNPMGNQVPNPLENPFVHRRFAASSWTEKGYTGEPQDDADENIAQDLPTSNCELAQADPLDLRISSFESELAKSDSTGRSSVHAIPVIGHKAAVSRSFS